MKSKIIVVLGILVLILASFFFLACSNENKTADQRMMAEKIYDETADAHADIQQAIATAQTQGKHILLMFGGNWCIWCHRLHRLFKEDKVIRKFLDKNYILVMVDVGKRDKNLDLNERYGNPFQHGFPVLVVLDKDGNQLHTQETGSLEYTAAESKKKGHHPERVLQFLKAWAPKK